MMDELINLVVEKTGLPEETAKQVVTIVLDFIREKLPDSFEGILDGFLDNDSAVNFLSGLGDLLGGKK
jgi:hypothetical protein